MDVGRLIDAVDIGVVVLDRDLEVRDLNRWVIDHAEASERPLVGRNLADLARGLPYDALRLAAREALANDSTVPVDGDAARLIAVGLGLARSLREAGGFAMRFRPVRDEADPRVLLNIVREAAGEALEEPPRRGVPPRVHDRIAVLERLEGLLARARAVGLPMAVLVLDLDGVGQVNQAHGLAAGDAAIAHRAELLTRLVRGHDLVGRLWGNCFLVALPGAEGEGAMLVAERLRRAFERQPAPTLAGELFVTASLGLAEGEGEADALVLRAEAAMREAKIRGRNRVERWSPEMGAVPAGGAVLPLRR